MQTLLRIKIRFIILSPNDTAEWFSSLILRSWGAEMTTIFVDEGLLSSYRWQSTGFQVTEEKMMKTRELWFPDWRGKDINTETRERSDGNARVRRQWDNWVIPVARKRNINVSPRYWRKFFQGLRYTWWQSPGQGFEPKWSRVYPWIVVEVKIWQIALLQGLETTD